MEDEIRAAREQRDGDGRDENHSATVTGVLTNGQDARIHDSPQDT